MFDNIPALISSFIAMTFAVLSYFLKQKRLFLLSQGLAIIFLTVSSFFESNFYAVIAYVLSLTRVVLFYALEQKDKKPPEWLKLLFVGAVLLSYLVLNVIILRDCKWTDILLIFANILYIYAFAIRNMLFVRLFFLIPTALSITYFVLVESTIFIIISYSFEFIASGVAAVLYSRKNKKTKII